MGKKKDLKRALKEAETLPLASPPLLAQSRPGDDEYVQISMVLTEGDRYRLKRLGLKLDTSIQRLGHRAWNAFLASHGQPGLTPVLTGTRGRAPAEE